MEATSARVNMAMARANRDPSFHLAQRLEKEALIRALLFMADAEPPEGLPLRKRAEACQRIEKRLAVHQLWWLRASAHVLTSQLLEEQQSEEANAAARQFRIDAGIDPEQEEWYDPPGRVAMPAPTGLGKTVTAMAFVTEVLHRYQRQRNRMGSGIRGIIYCASSVDLLSDALEIVAAMGGDTSLIGVYHTLESGPASIEKSEAVNYPIVFCTHQLIVSMSQDRMRLDTCMDDSFQLEDLMQFQEKERMGIWDEVFHAVDIAALSLTRIRDALSLIESNQLVRRLGTEEARVAVEALEVIYGRVSARPPGRPPKSPKPSRMFTFSLTDSQREGMLQLAPPLVRIKYPGAAQALRLLVEMSQNFLEGFAIPPLDQGEEEMVVQPVARIDPAVRRVVVLDASYRISTISQSDSTVRLASRLACSDVDGFLSPKTFERVRLHITPGPSGRQGLERDGRKRSALIRRQVQHLLEDVPPDERFVVVTFKNRGEDDDDEDACALRPRKRIGKKVVDWIDEIEKELERQGVPNWQSRAEFITWGQHRGRNKWREFKYGVAIGVIQRDWHDDLRLRGAALSWDLANANRRAARRHRVCDLAGEVASDVQQMIGRLHCRETYREPDRKDGVSGETVFWLEMYEPGEGNRKISSLGTSHFLERLRLAMPGLEVVTGPQKGKATSSVEQLAGATLAWIRSLPDEVRQISSEQLHEALRQSHPTVYNSMPDKTRRRAINQGKKAAVEELGWIEKSRRTLVRGSPPPSA